MIELNQEHMHYCPPCDRAAMMPLWTHNNSLCEEIFFESVKYRLCPKHYEEIAATVIPFFREQKISSDDFAYPNYWNGETFCFLEVWKDQEGNAAVICTERNENEGTSVTNQCETIASLVIEQFHLDIRRTQWIEHYPDRHSKSYDSSYDEQFDIVTFQKILEKPERLPRWNLLVKSPDWARLTLDDPRLVALECREVWPESQARARFRASHYLRTS